jgi:hypothetical protein
MRSEMDESKSHTECDDETYSKLLVDLLGVQGNGDNKRWKFHGIQFNSNNVNETKR